MSLHVGDLLIPNIRIHTTTGTGAGNYQNKSVTPTTSAQTITADSNYDALAQVTVAAISPIKSSNDITVSGATVTVPIGFYSSQATKTIASGSVNNPTATKGTVSNHSITVTPKVTSTTGYIIGQTNQTGTAVTITASELVSGSETKTVNGTYDVTNLAELIVNVAGSGTPLLQAKTNIDPSTSSQTITADSGYDGLSSVQINAMSIMTLPTTVANSGIGASKLIINRSTSAQYINIPAGYNDGAAYYTIAAVPNGTAGTPTATKGNVNNYSVTVTPSVTNTTGYITGSTKTGTAITVSASELVSGTKSITANGTGIDVTNYASVNVSVPSQDSMFIITLSWDDNYFGQNEGAWVPNCTFAQVSAAYNAGKEIAVKTNGDDAIADGWYYSGSSFNYGASAWDDDGLHTIYYIMDSNGIALDESYVTIEPNFETKNVTYTPTTSQQVNTIIADTNYNGLAEVNVTINAIPTYNNVSLDLIAQHQYITENNQRKWQYRTMFESAGGYIPVGNYYGNWITNNAIASGTIITPTTSSQTIGGANYMMEGAITIAAMPSGTAGTPTATKGTVSNHSISITPSVTNTTGYIIGSTKTGTAVTVSASELVSGTKTITANGTGIDVTNYASVDVAISGNAPTINSLTVTPTESEQTFNSSSVDGYKPVIVSAISSTYVGSGIAQKSSTDLTVNGATVTAPAGYYATAASKSVATMTLPTTTSASATSGYTLKATIGRNAADRYINIPPGYNATGAYYKISAVENGSVNNPTIIQGTVTNNSITLTPKVSSSAGFINGNDNQRGTAITISAADLVSGSQTITVNDTYDVTNLAQIIVDVPVGSTINNQDKIITPTTSQQTVSADSGYTGLGIVTVNAMPIANLSFDQITSNSPGVGSTSGKLTFYLNNVNIQATSSSTSGYVDKSDPLGTANIYLYSNILWRSATDVTTSTNTVTIPAGYYSNAVTKTIANGSYGTFSTSFSKNSSIFYVNITYNNFQAGYFSTSPTFTPTLSIENKNVTPSSTVQTITPTSNSYYLNSVTVAGDENLVAGNIKNGVSIFGVTGTYAGAGTNNQNKTVTPTESEQTVTADSGYTGLGTVIVEAIDSDYIGSGITTRSSSDLTVSGGTVIAPAGYYASAASKSVATMSLNESSTSSGELWNTIRATSTMTYINFSTGYNPTARYARIWAYNQSKTVTPNTTTQTVTADSGYSGLSSVTVNPIPSDYIDVSGIARDSSDLIVNGATITAPAGYYAADASASVATMTLPTSTASSQTSGYTRIANFGRSNVDRYLNIPPGYHSQGETYLLSAIANGSATNSGSVSGSSATITTGTNTVTFTKSVSITPTVTAGYISTGTAGDVSVSLTANITPRTSSSVTASGATVTIPAGYYASQVTKTISSGTATNSGTVSGSSATVSTGTNTLTLTKSIGITPTVTAGYISSGTAGTVSISLTASVTTKGAATITPGTSNQTIASGTYLTGTQTISGDSNLVGSNILSGVSIFGVAGSVSFITYYTGSSTPSSSLGNNGDIYLQS